MAVQEKEVRRTTTIPIPRPPKLDIAVPKSGIVIIMED